MKKIKRILITAIILIFVCPMVYKFYRFVTWKETNKYQLEEIQDGKYVIYYHVSSNIPAQNYDVAEIVYNGQLHRISGNISIVYSDCEPYALVTWVNFDKNSATIFVPKEMIIFENNVGLGR